MNTGNVNTFALDSGGKKQDPAKRKTVSDPDPSHSDDCRGALGGRRAFDLGRKSECKAHSWHPEARSLRSRVRQRQASRKDEAPSRTQGAAYTEKNDTLVCVFVHSLDIERSHIFTPFRRQNPFEGVEELSRREDPVPNSPRSFSRRPLWDRTKQCPPCDSRTYRSRKLRKESTSVKRIQTSQTRDARSLPPPVQQEPLPEEDELDQESLSGGGTTGGSVAAEILEQTPAMRTAMAKLAVAATQKITVSADGAGLRATAPRFLSPSPPTD